MHAAENQQHRANFHRQFLWLQDCLTKIGGKLMSDNLQDRGPQDRARINVNEEWELRYWTKELGVSEDQLRKAVQQAGPSVEAVRKQLKAA